MTEPASPINLALLSRCSLLSGAPANLLNSLLQSGTRTHVKARDVVFRRGDSGSSIFFLLDGGVKVSTLSRDGKEVIFDVLVGGDFFGEMSLFDDRPRTGTVSALVPSALFQVGKSAFLEALERHADLGLRLIQTLVKRLRLMDAFMEDVLFLDAEERLAKRIMALASLFGRKASESEFRIDLRVSQQEFANLVGITRESVNKKFREWEKAGVITMDKGFLKIEQPSLLQALIA